MAVASLEKKCQEIEVGCVEALILVKKKKEMALRKIRILDGMATRIHKPLKQNYVIYNIQDWIKDIEWEHAKLYILAN